MILKCKMCGGTLNITEGSTVCECEYCGSIQTIPNLDDEKKNKLYDRANRLRFNNEFDKASSVYEQIIADYPQEAEAYWGIVLSRYGIEYVDDPATGNKIPTCHRSSFDSVMEDHDFEMVMENADSISRPVYREEAKQIEEIRKSIIEVSGKEEPYDIFICYKETAEDGQRTIDSVLAQDVYDALTDKGYRVFFSRISLEDKLGTEYEPYIFAALNSAKVMLAFGTSYDYYNAVWVKNEWSRFLKLMAKDKSKHLIPCFRDIDAYDMPKEFQRLQSQDLGKVGAIQDLVRGIGKIIKKDEVIQVKETTVTKVSSDVDNLVKRAFIFLNDGDYKSARDYSERILDKEPENSSAYLIKLLIDLGLTSKEHLREFEEPFDKNINYKNLKRYGNDKKIINEVDGYLNDIKTRIKIREFEGKYQHAKVLLEKAQSGKDLLDVSEIFESIKDYKDSYELAREYREQANTIIKEAEYNDALSLYKNLTSFDDAKKVLSVFSKNAGYKDSDELAVKCKDIVNNWYNEEKYQRMIRIVNTQELFPYINEADELSNELNDYKDTQEIKKKIQTIKNDLQHKKEISNQKRKKSLITFACLALLVFFFVTGSRFFLYYPQQYQKAVDEFDHGNIKESERIFQSLYSYKDSKTYLSEYIPKVKFEKALEYLQNNDFETAISILKEINEFGDSNKILCSDEIMSYYVENYKPGDEITFGKNNGTPISWNILRICDDGKIFLLCKDTVVDSKKISDTESIGDVPKKEWQKTSLYGWLNNTFYFESFSSSEKERIYDSDAGKVFVLSLDEALDYQNYIKPWKCGVTGWWLRDLYSTSWQCINRDGLISRNYEESGVRPAMWICAK